MKMEPDSLTVKEILDLRQNKMLTVNAEYQRGPVWSPAQKKRLIDSIFRGYPIPLIYLHHIKRTVAGMQREDFEVIDGQQRINTLYEFKEGAIKDVGIFRLFDPNKDAKEARFPNFIREAPCPWGGCTFDTLPSTELKSAFLNTPLFVVKITTEDSNEARDLFIRLQAGLPLNAQEKRDAWPGGFTEFILKVGGKPAITRFPGHDFFRRLVGGSTDASRGKRRQLCAQMAMLFVEKHRSGGSVDIGTRAVDDFYYQNLDFDSGSPIAVRFGKVLDLLVQLLGNRTRRHLKGHEAIHALLFVDSLVDDYMPSWRSSFERAFDTFMHNVAKDKATRNSPSPGPYWVNYDARTRTDSDRAETIRLRHQFFAERMLEYMAPLQLKDPNRIFGQIERELIYFRDRKLCYLCGQEVAWSELAIHHVKAPGDGGRTTLENGRGVHQFCHPGRQVARGADEVKKASSETPEHAHTKSSRFEPDLRPSASVEEPTGMCPHGVLRTKVCAICDPDKFRKLYGDLN